jgi:glycosyltransferase involved in cell wall biosynthesis
MNCGCPVITTEAGSLKEVAGNAAYFVDPYSAGDIAKALHEVFSSNELRMRLSEKGLLQAKKFSWEKTAEVTISIYDKAR